MAPEKVNLRRRVPLSKHIHTCIHTYIHTYHVSVYIYTCVCDIIFLFIPIYVYTPVFTAHAYVYIYMYLHIHLFDLLMGPRATAEVLTQLGKLRCFGELHCSAAVDCGPWRPGPGTQYLRILVPRTIPLMAFGTRVLKYWVLGASG